MWRIEMSIGDYFYMRNLIDMRCWSDGCEMKVRNIQPIIEIKWGRNIPKSQSMQWKNEWKVISWWKRQTAMRLPLLSTAASAAIREITRWACFAPNQPLGECTTFPWPWLDQSILFLFLVEVIFYPESISACYIWTVLGAVSILTFLFLDQFWLKNYIWIKCISINQSIKYISGLLQMIHTGYF